MPYLPHPFEEVMSPSTPGESDDNDAASEFSWEDQRDAYWYIRDLNTVIDEREAESGERTPVLTVPVLPPILPSPLLVVDSGLDFDVPNPAGIVASEEETEWEADEVPSAWLREARRHLGRPVNPSTGAPPPLLELPNFSSTSLGLVEFSNGSGANPNSDATQATNAPSGNVTGPGRTSQDVLRRLPTEHLRQLRRAALRSVTSRSRSRSSMAPSVVSSDGEASRGGEIRAESVVSNEDIVVGVPPMLDEPFDRSVWRELEGRMQAHHHGHGHLRPAAEGSRVPPALDIRRQPRISLGPLSSGLHFDGEILGQREIINDTGSNISVRSAVASPTPGTTNNSAHATEGELGEWRQLVEGSLSTQAVPVLALAAPHISTENHTRPGAAAAGNWRMRRLEQIRSASSMSGEPSTTRLVTQAVRQTLNDYREGRLSEAQLENSLGVAMLEMRAEMESAGSFRSSTSFTMSSAGHPHSTGLVSSPQPLRRTAEAEAFRLLDSVWSNSNSTTVQGMSREMEFMERSLLERSAEVVPRRSHSPLWDTDDPLSEFLSDVGFDGSYEALMELSEQLGVVPRGLSDTAFAALQTAPFKDIEPDLVAAMSPAMSTISHSEMGSVDLTASMTMSPTHTTFASPRIRRARTGKWVAQCSICLEEYKSEDICVTLECTHFFHQPCVRQWFTSASTCPLCRHPLPRN